MTDDIIHNLIESKLGITYLTMTRSYAEVLQEIFDKSFWFFKFTVSYATTGVEYKHYIHDRSGMLWYIVQVQLKSCNFLQREIKLRYRPRERIQVNLISDD